MTPPSDLPDNALLPPAAEPDSDAMLVERTVAGDQRAFELLVIKYQRRIQRLIGRMVRDVDLVEDIAQETFIRAYRALPKFRGEAQFYTWLYRIAVNTAKKFLLELKRDPTISIGAFGNSDEENETFQSKNEPISDDTPETLYAAKEIANRRTQLQREQGIRTNKHITLDEIGRRLAIGDFKELNVIVKGDVDGSVEALADSLQKLSTEKVQVKIIHKSVGAISESDVLLASASNAIIIGFQVRPSATARKIADVEQIDIRLYSIIYKAIEEIQAAMEGMLAPEFQEKVVCNIEIREVFNITKVGTIAGCFVLDGKVNRNTKVRIIRDGIVVHDGELGSLKRFKDDVKEVNKGFECGLNINGFNDIKVGDIIEGYEMVEVKAKL